MTVASDIELCIHSYYSNEMDTGLRACERLLNEEGLEQRYIDMVLRNRTFYLKTLEELIPSVSYTKLSEPENDWVALNPSILRTDTGYIVNVRYVNYTFKDGEYLTPNGDMIRTYNKLVYYDKNLNVTGSVRLSDPEYPKGDFGVDGIEDCRLFTADGKIFVTGTVRNHISYNGWATIGMAEVRDADLVDLNILHHPTMGYVEKNWMPIIGAGSKWLYICGPITETITLKEGSLFFESAGPAPFVSKIFRGGSQVIPVGDKYIACIHEVAHCPGGRVYSHRFVEFDAGFSISRISIPFQIKEKLCVEFAAGLALSHDGQDLLLSFGVRDCEPWVIKFSCKDLEKLWVDNLRT